MEEKTMRLSQVAKILNKGLSSIASTLLDKGFMIEINPNSKISLEQISMLANEYKSSELLNIVRQTGNTISNRYGDAAQPNNINKLELAPTRLHKELQVYPKVDIKTTQTELPKLNYTNNSEEIQNAVSNVEKLTYEIEPNTRVNILPAANRIPISVNKSDTLETAKSLMMLHD